MQRCVLRIYVFNGLAKEYETFEKCSFLFKFKKGENFNRPSTIYRTYGVGRSTLSILRIEI